MKIAISGTIGSGKSTVSSYLRNKGYRVLDADEINARLLLKGNEGYVELKNNFFDILDESQNIDKSKLAKLVFNDNSELEKLNKIMHPLIKKEILKSFDGDNLVIAEIPLLFETDFYKIFDYYLLITVDNETAIERLLKRNMTKEDACARLKKQMNKEDKIKLASYVIDNSGNKNELYAKVDSWLESIELC